MPLASVYSTIDSAKRKIADALANPGASLEQFIGHKNDQAGRGLEILRKSQGPGEKPTAEGQDARSKIVEALSEGYNPAGILAGPMAKTADFGALKKAVQLEMKKAPPDEIWQETGWGRGLDKRWRWEISDLGTGPQPSAMKSAGPAGQVSNDPALWLADFDKSYNHPALFEAYPQLKAIRGKLGVDPTMGPRYAGEYMPGVNGGAGQILALGKDGGYLKDTVLHELQHGVQGLEKFAGGGSPQQFRGMVSSDAEAHALYERLKGEAEARLVSARAHFSPTERREQYPWNPAMFEALTGVHPANTFTTMPGPLSRP